MKAVLKVGVYGGAAALLGAALAVDFSGAPGSGAAGDEENARLLHESQRALHGLMESELMVDAERWRSLSPGERRAARDSWAGANREAISALESLGDEVETARRERRLTAVRAAIADLVEEPADSVAEELKRRKWALFERVGSGPTPREKRDAVDAWTERNSAAIAEAEGEEELVRDAERRSELAAKAAWEVPEGLTAAEEAYLTLHREKLGAVAAVFADRSVPAGERRSRRDEIGERYRAPLEFLAGEVEAASKEN